METEMPVIKWAPTELIRFSYVYDKAYDANAFEPWKMKYI